METGLKKTQKELVIIDWVITGNVWAWCWISNYETYCIPNGWGAYFLNRYDPYYHTRNI